MKGIYRVQGAGLQAHVYNVIICPWSMASIYVQIMRGFYLLIDSKLISSVLLNIPFRYVLLSQLSGFSKTFYFSER